MQEGSLETSARAGEDPVSAFSDLRSREVRDPPELRGEIKRAKYGKGLSARIKRC